MGTEEVVLIGGEAYLRPDWTDIVAAIKAERGAREGRLLFPGNNVGCFGPFETTLRGQLEPWSEPEPITRPPSARLRVLP